MFETILHVIWHAFLESIITLPVIFVCYLVIELLEERILTKYKTSKLLKSKMAPVVSASFGIIPQCGFSVVATDLYSKRLITLGSLMAIYIATSDEALPILLSNSSNYLDLLLIIGIKFVYAIVIGLLIDAIFRKKENLNSSASLKENNFTASIAGTEVDKPKNITENNLDYVKDVATKEEDSLTQDKHLHNEEVIEGCCHHDLKHTHESKLSHIFIHPLLHSLKIFAFILIINIVFGLLVEFVGENVISNFMMSTGFFQPFIVSIVGLIPNCAASVIITELFMVGGITLGSCIAGLCVNSGIALILLFRLNKNIKENILILVSLYLLGILLGVVINFF